jgi:XTP/dITP diphosphohydrolase
VRKLLIVTSNKGKVAELREMLAGINVHLASLDSFPHIREVAETGSTFDENARLKAIGYARQTGLPCLADDSGLEVDALGGRPGVLSARYAGEGTSFGHKIPALLREIGASGSENRSARFVCTIAIADEGRNILQTATGKCEGRIALSPRGNGGFGYDPIFIPTGYDLTFGELESAIKAQISHRAQAFSQIMPFLRHFMAKST